MNMPKMDLAALKNIDFSKVVAMAKRRGVLIASALLIIVVPVGAWWFRAGIKDSIQETMSKRGKEFEKLLALEKASVTVRSPVGEPRTETVSLNPTLIEALKARNESLEGEVKGVYLEALEYNRKNRDIVKTDRVVFPKPDPKDEQLIDEIFFPAIGPAYQTLLKEYRTGQPPASADVLEAVQRRESAFIQTTLKKKNRAEVTDAKELADLNAELLKARIAVLGERARETSVYLDPGAVRLPPSKGAISVDACFMWQWDLWVMDDIFRAVARANAGVKDGVISAPVKRIISIRIDPIAIAGAANAAGGEAAAPAEGAATVDAAGEPIAPATEITRDYKISFTGLKTCQLYDIRNVRLRLIVATTDLPKVLDAFARENFMTVTQLKLVPANTFEAARLGYIYGTEPCSEVSMTLQTVWLRDWTTVSMPAGVKKVLGTRGIEKPATDATEPAATDGKPPAEAPKS
ncbi:MAG: hypothetical protein K8R92_01980 [Planctomycetes bacterium]|nr:hypothetical protein [Planctomycetota bacterium]